MTANEVASVTGVPLRQVHRIIDAGLLGAAVKQHNNTRLLTQKGLVGLRLAHDTADMLTLQGRRAVVPSSIRSPRQSMIRAEMVVVEARPAAKTVRSGLSLLAKARSIVSSTPGVLSGTPVFKGTRIPVHEIADMLADGDREGVSETRRRTCPAGIDLRAGLSSSGPTADETAPLAQ